MFWKMIYKFIWRKTILQRSQLCFLDQLKIFLVLTKIAHPKILKIFFHQSGRFALKEGLMLKARGTSFPIIKMTMADYPFYYSYI